MMQHVSMMDMHTGEDLAPLVGCQQSDVVSPEPQVQHELIGDFVAECSSQL